MAQQKPYDPEANAKAHSSPTSDSQPILTPEESRQGVISGRVFLILTTSLVLALIAFVILYSVEIV